MVHYWRLFLIPVIYYLQIWIVSIAQPHQFQFRKLTIDDGLSSSTTISIFQDYIGFIWIGTYDGLNRYDGTSFTIYKNIKNDTASIPENHIRSIFQSKKNELFIGTHLGLSRYDRDKNTFHTYLYDPSSPFYQNGFSVFNIVEDNEGTLWMATDFGIVTYNPLKNTSQNFLINPKVPGDASNYFEDIHIDKRDRIWVAARTGLYIFNPQTERYTLIEINEPGQRKPRKRFFLSIAEESDGTLWFGSTEGLFMLPSGANPVPGSFVIFRHEKGNNKSLSGNNVKTIFIDKENQILIGTENNGINLYDKANNNFIHYGTDPYNPKSISNEHIQAIMRDRTGNLWVCTYMGGVNIASYNSQAILHYNKLPGAPYSLSHNVITSFHEDRSGKVWVGTDGGGLNLFDPSTGRSTNFTSAEYPMSSDAILCLMEDSQHKMWIGTWSGGIMVFNPSSHTFRSYTTNNSGIPDNNIYSIVEGVENELWLGSFENGLINFNVSEESFKSYNTKNSDIIYSMINVIRKDDNSNLYIGTVKGFQIYNFKKRVFSSIYTNVPGDSLSLSHNNIQDILLADDTTIWLCTGGGLNRFNPETGKISRFEETDLPLNIKGVETDNYGTIWISTGYGLFCYQGETGKLRKFIKADGLQGNQFFERSHIRLNNGALFFGGTNGFNIIYPEKLKENTTPPAIVFTEFRIFNEKILPGTKNSPLEKDISQTKEIILRYRNNYVLTFAFSALDFTIPSKNQFSYMMENFDENWIKAGSRREVTYTNLDPGDYIFRVKASNNDGIWNNEGVALKLTILPPWWGTWLFRIIVFFSLIAFVFVFSSNRSKRFSRQKQFLEKMVEQRTRELAEKNNTLNKQADELNEVNTILEERQQRIEEQTEKLKLQTEVLEEKNRNLETLNATKDKFFSIVAHDLKNPFTSIIGFSEILLSRYEKYDEEKRLNLIRIINQSSENVFKLLENLLEWSRSQTGTLKFQPENMNLLEMANYNIVLLQNLLDDKKLKINIEIENDHQIFADKNMINTVLRNLLTNAAKFTENGDIFIRSEASDGFIIIEIKDSGMGMDKERLRDLFKIGGTKSSAGTRGETGTGLGLILCKEFVEKNGGTIWAESEPGKGSSFFFTIPVPGDSATTN